MLMPRCKAAAKQDAGWREIWRCRRATFALEMALVSPLLVLFLFGFYDVTQILTIQRRMQLAANAVVQVATNRLASLQSTNTDHFTLGSQDAVLATNAVFPFLPDWVAAPQAQMTIVLRSVKSANGSTGTPLWTYASAYGGKDPKPCNAFAIGTGSYAIPTGTMQSPYLLVAEVDFKYVPMFSVFFSSKSGVSLSTYAYMGIRDYSGTKPVDYTPKSDKNLTSCA